jgi:cytoskeleton protein RodZ
MKVTGQLLKERRESLRLSLSEISMSTKVNQKILKAIEEGDSSQLPAKTFLRGFVQAYASALKMDVDEIMKTFLEEMGTTTPEVTEAEDMSAQVISGRSLPSSMESSMTFKVLAVSGIVVLILLVIGVKSLVEKYEQESRVEPVPETLVSLPPPAEEVKPASNEAVTAEPGASGEETAAATAPDSTPETTETAPVTPEKTAEVNPTPPPLPVSAPVAAAPEAKEPAPEMAAPSIGVPEDLAKSNASPAPPATLTTPPASPVAAAIPSPNAPVVKKAPPQPASTAAPAVAAVAPPTEKAPAKPEAPATPPEAETPKEKAPAASTEATAPTATPPAAAPEEKKKESLVSKEVILEALDRIEVAVKVDNGNLKKIILQPDEVYTIKGLGKIVLDLSDGGAVNLIVNGQDRGVPGDLGKPKKVEIP